MGMNARDGAEPVPPEASAVIGRAGVARQASSGFLPAPAASPGRDAGPRSLVSPHEAYSM